MQLSKIFLLIAFLIPIQALAAGVPMNAVAVHPANRNEMYAASDSAGLFKSTNGGLNWSHVVSLPVSLLQAVAYLPADPNIVLVTAKADVTGNGGGIWRSLDGGWSWDQATLEPELAGLSAYEISAVGESVVVGTSAGIFFTVNGGEDWTFASPYPPTFANQTVYSVLLTPGSPSRIYAGGPSGPRMATTSALDQWTAPAGVGGVYSIHAFGRSALSANQAYAVVGHLLYRIENGGANWSVITSAPHANPCQGIPFIKTALRSKGTVPQFLHLFYGNGCGLHHLAARVFPGVDYSGPWQQRDVGNFSPRDLALFQGVPALLASNAGLHLTADGGVTWTLVSN